MSKFITGKELGEAVYDIIWEAENQLMIVSPYIKLGDYFKDLFIKHLNKPKLQLTIMFGKNEGRVDKSVNKNDLEFFLQFPNISVVYVPHLHAKYYANEIKGVLTSINLYDFSFKNNIEFGVLYEAKLFSISKSPDAEVWDTCHAIADDNEVIFVKRPIYEKGFMGLSKNYNGSKVLLDRTLELYSGKPLAKGNRKLEDFEEELNSSSEFSERPTREEVEKKKVTTANAVKATTESVGLPNTGYCIRTGVQIPFNPERPMCYQAYQKWSQFGNPDFPEKYCHYSGEPSNGETSVKRPILFKNWKSAKKMAKA